jgi:hypothetical protein
MSAWITTALVLAITAGMAGTAANASCAPKAATRCFDTGAAVDLNSVRDIANKIVGEEPIDRPREKPTAGTVAPTPYTGPILGAAPGKRTPTVGYSWSLE